MTKSLHIFFAPTILTLLLISGCNKATDFESKVEAPAAPTSPAKPSSPESIGNAKQEAQPTSAAIVAGKNASADVTATVGTRSVEASAGDVSVKLPE
jgi:PBP1b-binding outer membrane lipoprotein LpoB